MPLASCCTPHCNPWSCSAPSRKRRSDAVWTYTSWPLSSLKLAWVRLCIHCVRSFQRIRQLEASHLCVSPGIKVWVTTNMVGLRRFELLMTGAVIFYLVCLDAKPLVIFMCFSFGFELGVILDRSPYFFQIRATMTRAHVPPDTGPGS